MSNREREVRAFGYETRHIDELIERYRETSSPKSIAFSLLSDVQETIDRVSTMDSIQKQEIRQAINRVKYILTQHVKESDNRHY